MSNFPRGLMTNEAWSSYLSDWCWSILQEKKRDSSDALRINSRWLLTKEGYKATESCSKRKAAP